MFISYTPADADRAVVTLLIAHISLSHCSPVYEGHEGEHVMATAQTLTWAEEQRRRRCWGQSLSTTTCYVFMTNEQAVNPSEGRHIEKHP